VSIDKFPPSLERLTLLKCDVEGADLYALRVFVHPDNDERVRALMDRTSA
jgi:hypothetical protein